MGSMRRSSRPTAKAWCGRWGFASRDYDPEFRLRLKALLGGQAPEGQVAAVAQELTLLHGAAVRALLAETGMTAGEIDVIGFHGHTILHEPAAGRTWQIGDGALLAQDCGIDVVADLRSNDMRLGGEGAPLAPLYHLARASDLERPLAVLNIGGGLQRHLDRPEKRSRAGGCHRLRLRGRAMP